MWQSIKSILTSVKKNRLFYFINFIGFLTGLLILTVISTFVLQEISFDRFHKNAENIYRIRSGGYGVTPYCFAEQLRNGIPELDGIVRLSSTQLTLVDTDTEVDISNTYFTDPEFFNFFSFKLLSGETSEVLNAPFSIVINRSTAHKLFGKVSPVGETIQDKNGAIYTITGVMEDFPYHSHIQANALISIESRSYSDEGFESDCGSWGILTYISIMGSADKKETADKINFILDDSRIGTDEGKFTLELQPLKKIYFDAENNKFDGSVHGNRQTVLFYTTISILLLLIVMINYINLSTLIAGGRIKEIAIRKICGANRVQIIQQIVLEAFGMVLISFLIALSVVELLLPQLSNLLNITISDSQNRSLLYLYYFIGISIVGLISGLFPGVVLSGINEVRALKNESFLRSRGIQRKVLLVFQLLIVAVFLNSTFIITNQINSMLRKDIGFQYNKVVFLSLDQSLIEKWEALKGTLLQSPEIESISFSDRLFGEGFTKSPMNCNDKNKLCTHYSIDPDYFDLYKIGLKHGRNFSWDLSTDLDSSCIINERACEVFELENPIGTRINNYTVTGVFQDFNYTSLHYQIEPLVIKCHEGGRVIQLRISMNNSEETIGFIHKTCKDLSPDYMGEASFLNDRIRELYKPELDLKSSFSVYSGITFIIALLGIFGLFLFTLKKKVKEVSIRKLFGASLRDTFVLLIKEQLIIVTISNIVAVPITYFVMSNWLNNFQFREEIGITEFLKTYLVTAIFTAMIIFMLIIRTHRTSLIESIQCE
jgi:putative ABC transport system permease protein